MDVGVWVVTSMVALVEVQAVRNNIPEMVRDNK
jgi:hypothetical protein